MTDATVLFGQDRNGRPARYVDLGLAMGSPAWSACAPPMRAPILLAAATDWLLAQELSPEHPTRFRPWCHPASV